MAPVRVVMMVALACALGLVSCTKRQPSAPVSARVPAEPSPPAAELPPTPTMHVRPDGDDRGDGRTPATAFRTMAAALSRARPGDVIMLAAGAIFQDWIDIQPGKGGTAGLPLTITSDPVNRAKLVVPANRSGVTIYNAGDVTIENLILVGQSMNNPKSFGVNAMAQGGRFSRLVFRNLDVSGFFEGLQVVSWERPSDGFSNVLIEGCDLHHNLNGGGMTYAPAAGGMRDFVVRHCRFHHNLGDPSEMKKPSGSGFVFGGVEDGLIEHCVAHDNGGQGPAHPGPVGIWAYHSKRVTIQHCESYRNRAQQMDGDGFDFDMGVTDSVIQYCYSHDNHGAGYLLYQSGAEAWSNNVVRYNVSENDASGSPRRMAAITLSSLAGPVGLRDASVYGNTVYTSVGAAFLAPWEPNASGLRVFNNIIVTTNNHPLVWSWNKTPAGITRFQGNLYWASGGTVDVEGFSSLDAWRQATGQEMLAGEPVGLLADPHLTAAGGGGTVGRPNRLASLGAYRLQAGSPAIDAGLDPARVLRARCDHDFFGLPVPTGAGYDIGAHEAGPPREPPP